jgi:hypothetical protein
MRKTNPDRGWRGAAFSALAAVCLSGATICLSGAALAASSVPPATSSDNPPARQTAPSTSTGASSSTTAAHKSTTHKSSTHKTSTHKATTQAGASKTSSHHSSSSGQKTAASRGKKSSKNSRTAKKRAQQAIDRERARAIQEALIREHYMNGEPSGTWDSATQAAMQRYQADQGWQSKTTPDSRALIKLGLGPSNDHLLNPESAMTSAPASGDPKATTKTNTAATPRPQQ